MRLIDADEFAIEEPKLWDWDSIDGISSTKVLKQCIWDVQCAPEVKAIHIEFIKQLIEEFDCERGNAIKDTFAHILTGLLEFWEFEQEKENE